MKKILFISFFSFAIIMVSAQTMSFVHPGAIHSQEELLFVKDKIAAGAQPWTAQYNNLKNWAVAGSATIPVLPDEGGQKTQAQRAYANALAYWYSGNIVYANQAIAILKAWANITPYYVYDGKNLKQDMLDCAWMGTLLGPAADLLRNYMSPADLATITNMFKTVFVPSLIVRDVSNGNRDLEQIDAMFSISVFCEDKALFDRATLRLSQRMPCYVYLKSDGPNPPNIPGAQWYPTNFASPNADGVMQESCRDWGHHTPFAMNAFIASCETAWHQGVDLYGQYQTRIIAGMELLAKQFTTGDMQGVCTNSNTTFQENRLNGFDIGYNHYYNRLGIPLPETKKVLPITRGGNSDWNVFYETLTHGEVSPAYSPCTKPVLGSDRSICGFTSLTLNSGINTKTAKTGVNKSITWSKDKVIITGQTATSLTVTQPGVYSMSVDSLGCVSTAAVTIKGAMSVDLGKATELCNPVVQTLDAGNQGANFAWNTGAKTQTVLVSKPGTYSVTVSASNCATVSGSIVITSKLLPVKNDTICSSGIVDISVLGTSSYNWYDVPTGGTVLYTGLTYNPSITNSKNYYVEDATGMQGSFGKTDVSTGATVWNLAGTDFAGTDKCNQVTVLKPLSLSSVSVFVNVGGNVTINFKQGTTTVFTKTVNVTGTGLQVIPLQCNLIPGSYIIDAVGSTASLAFEASGATFPYSYPNFISFTYNQTWQSAQYGLFYNWQITSGNVCARTPVQAVIDPLNSKCSNTGLTNKSIALQQGWNLISTNVYLLDSSITTVFTGLDVQEIKTLDAYWRKGQNIALNSLNTITSGQGYLVNMNIAGILNLKGLKNQSNLSVTSLQKGWNLIGCPYQATLAFSTLFNDLNTISVKNFEGFWMPMGTLNSITNLDPGKAYFIKSK